MNLPMIETGKGSRVYRPWVVRKKKEQKSQEYISVWACGAMETRQTTNLKIAGSTPARLVFFDTVKGSQGKSKGTQRATAMWSRHGQSQGRSSSQGREIKQH